MTAAEFYLLLMAFAGLTGGLCVMAIQIKRIACVWIVQTWTDLLDGASREIEI